jgi:hypothetical protein
MERSQVYCSELTGLIPLSFTQFVSFVLVLINQYLFLTSPVHLSNHFQETSVKSRMAGQPGLYFSSPFYGGD